MLDTRPLYSSEQITGRVAQLAAVLNQDYQGRTVDVICVLKGSICFAADLIRLLSFPVRLHFMQVRSYESGTENSGTVHLYFPSDFELNGRDVLLVEDIVDTGITLQYVLQHLGVKDPASLKTCALLDKPARRKVNVHPDYCGFTIENVFVVGYGLDYNEFGRNLPYVGVLAEKAD